MKLTISKALAMEKSLRERLGQLKALAIESSKRSIWEDSKKMDEPTYDVKKVDKKITEINKALFELNHSVKDSNAKTALDVEIDYNDLVSEIE